MANLKFSKIGDGYSFLVFARGLGIGGRDYLQGFSHDCPRFSHCLSVISHIVPYFLLVFPKFPIAYRGSHIFPGTLARCWPPRRQDVDKGAFCGLLCQAAEQFGWVKRRGSGGWWL